MELAHNRIFWLLRRTAVRTGGREQKFLAWLKASYFAVP